MTDAGTATDFDVVIAGAGPAGLSAALVLGRACRSVLLCDTSTPRSWASKAMHGFLTRDGISPAEFRNIAHAQLERYATVVFREAEVRSAERRADGGFDVVVDGAQVVCRKLLIATGVLDHVPQIEGFVERFGKSVFQCPYCDGWEARGRPAAVYGKRRRGFEMARALTAWTHDILLCTDGPARFSSGTLEALEASGIELVEEKVVRLTGQDGSLDAVVFASGRAAPRDVLFFDTPSSGQSRLAESLGCRFTRAGGVRCGDYEATSVPGVFVAGNIIRDVQLAIVAAAEGTRAAFGINRALTREAFERAATGRTPLEHPEV